MYDKIKGTLHLNKIASPRKHTVDKPTTYTRATLGPSLPRTSTHFTVFSLPKWEKFSHHPLFQEELRETKQKIQKLVLPSTSSAVLQGHKIPTLQMNQMLSIGVSSCMYNGWTRITASEKARICDLRLNWYSHTWKPMNMVWKFSIKTEFTPKLAF